MDEWTEQMETLLSDRMKQIKAEADGYGKAAKSEIEKRCEQVNRILFTLSEADRQWMDQLLVDQHILSEDAQEMFYRAGLRDGIRMLLWFLKEP